MRGWILFLQGGAALLFFVAGVATPLRLPADPVMFGWWSVGAAALSGLLYLLIAEWIRRADLSD